MKLHISLKVSDLEKSRAFYSQLFGMEPTIERDDYVKWDVQDPSVNFVIEPGKSAHGLDHLGIQVETDSELETLTTRIRGAGQPYLDVESTTCCYAKSDKAWVKARVRDAAGELGSPLVIGETTNGRAAGFPVLGKRAAELIWVWTTPGEGLAGRRVPASAL